jgi:hypothetical protein
VTETINIQIVYLKSLTPIQYRNQALI